MVGTNKFLVTLVVYPPLDTKVFQEQFVLVSGRHRPRTLQYLVL